jgi:hypothetical protein
VNDVLERMWKKAVVTYFKVLSQHLYGKAEENQEETWDFQSLGKESNLGHLEYQRGVLMLTTHL